MSLFQQNRARVGLEPLESREVMTVMPPTFTLGGIMTVTGDGGSDKIEIVDTGLTGAGQLHFRINGGSWNAAPVGVWRVAVDMGGGNDTVIYNMGRSFDASKPDGLGAAVNGKIAGRYAEIEANLGSGVDTFDATVHGTVAGPNGMRVLANGQNGNDTITGRLNGDVTGGAHMGFSFHGGETDNGVDFINVYANDANNDADVAAGSVLWTNVSGGAGNDNIQYRYDGEVDGQVELDLEGDAGADWVRAEVTLDAGSLGRLGNGNGRARVYGGDGDYDTADFFVFGTAALGVDAEVGGGLGLDTVHRTANVVWLGD